MSDKIIKIRYDRNGISLITEGLSDDEESTIKDEFQSGEEDPSKLRELVVQS